MSIIYIFSTMGISKIVCIFAAETPTNMRKIVFAAFFLGMLSGCDMFDYHPYDTRFDGETDINAHHIAQIERDCANRDTLRVALMSDTHEWYGDMIDEINDINARDSIDFVIHLGDFTDGGTTREYEWARDKMSLLKKPYIALIGNHDFLGTGDSVFETMFGALDFSFIAGRVKFICLNTNATEYDYLAAVPNFDFLESEMVTDTTLFDRTVLCMHARPYSDQFNNNVAKAFSHYVRNLPGIMFCVNGHDHSVEEEQLFDDGITYYGVDCASHRHYAIVTITPNAYQYEVISF